MQSALKKAVPPYKRRPDSRLKNSTLVCPDCYRPLLREENLSCSACRRSWDEVEGVPFFSAIRGDWAEIPEAEMVRVNESARKDGWRKAIDEKIKGPYPHIHDDITDEARADFRFVLPLQPQSKVLELGAGFGTISFGLQPYCGWVAAVEWIAERAKFIEIRREQEGLQNMEVAVSNGLELPFAPETFDFIVMSGYLESIGLADPKTDPGLLQKKFLAQLHRLLKPGGAVYIGIENRFGYAPLLGGDRSALKDKDLLSRWRGSLSRRSFLKPDRAGRVHNGDSTCIYGKRGYRKLLTETGFLETEFFMPHPGYNQPLELISLDHPYPFQFFLNNAVHPTSLMGKIKKKAALLGASVGLTQLFSPHFSIVAWKEGRYD